MTKTSKLTMTALFAALTCIATMLIKIPTPATQGYIHFGDAFVILAGVIPGGVYGMMAAGIGSALADIFSGYAVYAPATFVIKALCALAATAAYRNFSPIIKANIARLIIGGIFSTCIVAGGYFLYEFFFYGIAAAVEIPSNLIQGGSGIVISCLLFPVLSKVPQLKTFLNIKK